MSSRASLFPQTANLNAEKVRAGIDLAVQQMCDRGWQAENCLVRPDESAAPEVELQLRAAAYDCVVIADSVAALDAADRLAAVLWSDDLTDKNGAACPLTTEAQA